MNLPPTPFNPLDWLLLLLLAYSTVKAFLQGFFRSAFALAGLVVGVALAGWFYESAATYLHLATQPIRQCIAFLAILIVTMIAFSIAGKLLRRTASAIGLGFLDRLAGALFGLIRGALFGSALLGAFTAFLAATTAFGRVTGSDWVRTSVTAPYFLQAARAVSFVLPQDFTQRLHDGVVRIKHTAPDWIKSAP